MHTYASIARLADSARVKSNGKPLGNNTRAFRRGDDCVAIKFHNTDIVTFYRDGRMKVNVGWLDSPTTHSRIWEYAHKSFHTVNLPLYNRRRPTPYKLRCIQEDNRWVVVQYNRGDIEFGPNGKLDMDSITGQTIEVVADPKGVRAMERRAALMCQQIEVIQRLGRQYSKAGSVTRLADWFREHIDTPLDQIDFVDVPTYGATFKDGILDPRPAAKEAVQALARIRGYCSEVLLKDFVR